MEKEVQKTSDYRQGTGGRKSAPIIGRAVNQMLDFLTLTKKSSLGGRKSAPIIGSADNRKFSVGTSWNPLNKACLIEILGKWRD